MLVHCNCSSHSPFTSTFHYIFDLVLNTRSHLCVKSNGDLKSHPKFDEVISNFLERELPLLHCSKDMEQRMHVVESQNRKAAHVKKQKYNLGPLLLQKIRI